MPFLIGCAGSTDGGDCTSHYQPVADAPTREALKKELLEHVDPRVRSMRVIREHPDKGKVYVNLINRRHRSVMSLDMWQRDDGTWTAQQWSQCID
ncbi:hypothetical protein GCM10009844_13180 [Nocardioides koreensis]|uniref:Lipoprotein n=1 Tax=Nocardioides koreensis TaxID=433651 RepID=A0ABP5L5T2_9ACTN